MWMEKAVYYISRFMGKFLDMLDNLNLFIAESMSDEETELAKLVAPPTDSSHLFDSSMDQDSLYNSSMGSSSLGQSMGGGGAGGVAGEGEAEVPQDVRVERSPEKQMPSEMQDQTLSCK